MKWFDWIKTASNYFGRERVKDSLARHDPTSGYHANRFYHSEVVINDLPLFTLWTGRLMLRSDPVVSFALNVRNACLMGADFEVTAKDPKVKAWVEENWSLLWNKHRLKLTSAKKFGFAAMQVLFKKRPDGMDYVEGLKDFAPEDVRPLEHGGKVCGFRLRGAGAEEVRVKSPRALWITHDAEYGSPYGNGILRRQYPPWWEKWMPHGAKKLTQQRMIKDAYVGDTITYPPNLVVEIPDGQGGSVKRPWKDVLREIVENRLSGGAMALPHLPGKDGENMVKYTPPQGIAGGTDIFQWTDNLDEAIFMGADVPLEVVQASETGSGFSGRSIPLMVVLSVCTDELIEITQCVADQVLRPVAWLNFGGDPEFEIKPKPLVESFAKDAGGSPMGGGAVGGQPGSKPPGQNGQPQQIPQKPQPAAQFDEGFEQKHPRDKSGRFAELLKGTKPGGRSESLLLEADAEGEVFKHPDTGVWHFGAHSSPTAWQAFKAGGGAGRKTLKEQHDELMKDIQRIVMSYKAAGVEKTAEETSVYHFLQELRQKIVRAAEHRGASQFDEGPAATEEIHAPPLAAARRRILAAAELIRALKKKNLILPRLAELIESELQALRPGIQADLSASIFGGHVTGMADSIASVPATFEPPSAALSGPPAVPPSIPPLTALLFPDGEPEGVRFPVLDDALELLEVAPTASTIDYRQTAALAREGAFAITGDLTDQAVADVRDALAKTIREGGSEADFVDTVVSRMGDEGGPLSEAHIAQVFRTNTSTAISDGQHKALAQPLVADAFPYRAYFATTDQRVRPEHIGLERLGLDGTNIYRADDPTWLKFRPPWDFGCLLPGTIVQGRIEAVLRSFYSGKSIEFVTASGKRLRVTVNHPVLTPRGFVAAESLKSGDDVLSYMGINDIGSGADYSVDRPGIQHATYDPRRFSPDVNEQYFPTTVADVFASLALNRKLCRLPVGSNDLHGEARRGNGYVDVVWADWELPSDCHPEILNLSNQLGFTKSDSLAAPFEATDSEGGFLGSRLDVAASSLPRSAALTNNSGGVCLEPLPLRQLCLGSAAYLNASRYETTAESISGASALIGQLLQGYPGSVVRDQVVQIRQFDYSGHVFDVQAGGGWLVGDGVIVSNCRCSWSPTTVLQASRQGVTEAKEWWARAKAMATELGGSPDEYLSRTAPAEPARVSPPPFSPSPEFERR